MLDPIFKADFDFPHDVDSPAQIRFDLTNEMKTAWIAMQTLSADEQFKEPSQIRLTEPKFHSWSPIRLLDKEGRAATVLVEKASAIACFKALGCEEKEVLFALEQGSLDSLILQAHYKSVLKTGAPHLSEEEINKIVSFVMKNKEKLQGSYVHSNDELPRTVEFVGDKIFVHLSRKKKGDKVLGEGTNKIVKFAIELGSGKLFASASMKSSDENELENLRKLIGIQGFVQMEHEVSYMGKKGRMKQRLLLELHNQGDLWRHILEDDLSPENKKNIGIGLIHALATLHRKGLIHRDLKPANILLHQEPGKLTEATIADVGTVCEVTNVFRKALHQTTCWYVPPDYASALLLRKTLSPVTSRANDVWALGVVLYQMYINKYPFWTRGKSEKKIFLYISNIPLLKESWFKEPSDPNSLEHLIWEMLNANSKTRITMDEVEKRLDQVTWIA